MSDYLPAVTIEPEQAADAAVIWLHGLGADGHDFEPVVPQLGLAGDLAVRFIFPHAPAIPVALNGGMRMPAWFDVSALDGNRSINSHQLLASAAAVHKLLDREIESGIAGDRIIVGGFSQGGAVVYQAALSYDKPLGGMFCLSSFFPTADAVTPHPANHGLPVLVCHGSADDVLDIALGERSVEALKALGLHPVYKTYPMGHGACQQEIEEISRWMRSILG